MGLTFLKNICHPFTVRANHEEIRVTDDFFICSQICHIRSHCKKIIRFYTRMDRTGVRRVLPGAKGITTLRDDKELYFTRDISQEELTEIFDRVEHDLNQPIRRYHDDSDHFFDILVDIGYKSFRVHPEQTGTREREHAMPFRASPVKRNRGVRKPRKGLCRVILKAFSHAPPWTTEEVAVVYNILSDYGVIY